MWEHGACRGHEKTKWLMNQVVILDESDSVSRSVVSDSATPWTVVRQAPVSLGFSRQEYWSGLPCPSPGNLSDPGFESRPLTCRHIFCHCSTRAKSTLDESPLKSADTWNL